MLQVAIGAASIDWVQVVSLNLDKCLVPARHEFAESAVLDRKFGCLPALGVHLIEGVEIEKHLSPLSKIAAIQLIESLGVRLARALLLGKLAQAVRAACLGIRIIVVVAVQVRQVIRPHTVIAEIDPLGCLGHREAVMRVRLEALLAESRWELHHRFALVRLLFVESKIVVPLELNILDEHLVCHVEVNVGRVYDYLGPLGVPSIRCWHTVLPKQRIVALASLIGILHVAVHRLHRDLDVI